MTAYVKPIFNITEIVSAPFLKLSSKSGVFRIQKRENDSKNSEKIHKNFFTNTKTFCYDKFAVKKSQKMQKKVISEKKIFFEFFLLQIYKNKKS